MVDGQVFSAVTKRRIAAGILAAGLGAGVPAPDATAAGADVGSVNWGAVAQCESGDDWSMDTGNGFYGGLQFAEPTWLAYGGGQYAQYPNQASVADQIAVAENVLAGQGIGAWPGCGANAGSGAGYSGTNAGGPGSGWGAGTAGTGSSGASGGTQQVAPQLPAMQQTGLLGGHSYTVSLGDTLSGIAAKLGLGNWHSLYHANTIVLGGNPDLIMPGQVLGY